LSQIDLPRCSANGCSRAAGVIIRGSLYCSEHASRVIADRSKAQKAKDND
jgi:hypothetical protein